MQGMKNGMSSTRRQFLRTASAGALLPSALGTRLQAEYHSSQLRSASEPDSPGYTLVNWYLDYAVTRNLSLHTGIENIGNERLANDDPDDYDRVDPGRRYFAGLTVSF